MRGLGPDVVSMVGPTGIELLDFFYFCGSFLLIIFCVCHAVLYVHCSLVDTCWEKANLLALLHLMFFYCFCGVLGQVWYMIVSNPDLCLLPYLRI